MQAIKKNLFMLLHFGLDNSKIFIITYLVLIFYATKNDILESIFRIETNLICVPISALTYFNFDPFSMVFYCAITYYPFLSGILLCHHVLPILSGIPLCHHVLPLSLWYSIVPSRITPFFLCFHFGPRISYISFCAFI